MLNGKPVYVDENGYARDPITGDLLLDDEGNPIKLNEDGDLASASGVIKKDLLKKRKR